MPPIKKGGRSNCRWTTQQEEYYGERSVYRGSGFKGLRIGNRGITLLNCWFEDDVEAEMLYTHSTSFNNKQVLALAFYTKKNKALGGNLGSQATYFTKQRPRKRVGPVEALLIDKKTRVKIKVSDGTFEVYRDGHKKASLKYSEKSYTSGRVGFIWGGGLVGAIGYLTITGKLDVDEMYKALQKRRR